MTAQGVPPRVMIVLAAADVSGPAKGVFQLLASFRNRPGRFKLHNFRVVGREAPLFEEEVHRAGFEFDYIDQTDGLLHGLRSARRAAKDGSFDIVQTHGFKPTVFGLYLKLTLGMKWVCFLHGKTAENFKVRAYHALDHLLQRFADRVVLVAESQRKMAIGGGDRRRVRVLYNAVDMERPARRAAHPRSIRSELGLPSSARLVSVVGRLSPEKGGDVFIDAFARLVQKDGTVGLLIGDGQERPALEQRAAAAGLGQRVRFLGYTPFPGDYIEQSDLVVIPSHSEACPNVLLEAMALRTPVVSTRVGGVPELVDDGVEALVVPPGDPAALAAAMDRVLGDRALALSLAAAALERVRTRYSTTARAAAVYGLYQELLGIRSDAGRGAEHARAT